MSLTGSQCSRGTEVVAVERDELDPTASEIEVLPLPPVRRKRRGT
jgi:hypothetical protein